MYKGRKTFKKTSQFRTLRTHFGVKMVSVFLKTTMKKVKFRGPVGVIWQGTWKGNDKRGVSN